MKLATLYRLRITKVQVSASLSDTVHFRQKRANIEEAGRLM
jgi:hypothetical protein